MFWQVLFEIMQNHHLQRLPKSAYFYRVIQTGPHKGLTKTFQFFGNNLVKCINKNSKWSKIFGILGIISASSDMVWEGHSGRPLAPNSNFIFFNMVVNWVHVRKSESIFSDQFHINFSLSTSFSLEGRAVDGLQGSFLFQNPKKCSFQGSLTVSNGIVPK